MTKNSSSECEDSILCKFMHYYKKDMIIIKDDNELFDDNRKYNQLKIISSKDKQLNSIIDKSDIIVIIGNITIPNEYNDKFIININNSNNKGYFTCNLKINNKIVCNNVIYIIYSAIFNNGLVRLDLYDVASMLNGNCNYNRIETKYLENMSNLLDKDYKGKILLILELPYNVTFDDINSILDPIREKYKESNYFIGLPIDEENSVNNITLNIFYENN